MIMIGKTEYNKTKETYGNLFFEKNRGLGKRVQHQLKEERV